MSTGKIVVASGTLLVPLLVALTPMIAASQAIGFVTICNPATSPGTTGTCPTGEHDTHQLVLSPAPATQSCRDRSINCYTDKIGDFRFLADEHSTVFAPGQLKNNQQYVFFAASGNGVLQGALNNGQWQLDIDRAYGAYGSQYGNGPVFASAMQQGYCPTAGGDATFDLNYAAPGGVVKDPIGASGSLLMVYEGTNACAGSINGQASRAFYATIAIATSGDFGHTWPSYRYLLDSNGNLQFPLPLKNPCSTVSCQPPTPYLCMRYFGGPPPPQPQPLQRTNQGHTCYGPNAPGGAFGDSVCVLNHCHVRPPSTYGRYPILSPTPSLASVIRTRLNAPLGYSAPSAFLDDVGGNASPSLYVVSADRGDLVVARAQLNGGRAPLKFSNGYGGSFSTPGIGGPASPISYRAGQGTRASCQAQHQHRIDGSISYVGLAHAYLLTFVCLSPKGDPADTSSHTAGAAWFFAVADSLGRQDQWSAPQEIQGSFAPTNTANPSCYEGWYPTFMSLNDEPGHLEATGYVFYTRGCLGGQSLPVLRRYYTRAFTIALGNIPAASAGSRPRPRRRPQLNGSRHR